MNTETYSNADVVKLTGEKLVSAKINSDKNEALWKKFATADAGLPATFFLDADGATVAELVGFMGAADYLDALKRILAAHPKLRDAKAAAEKSAGDGAAQFALAEVYADLRRDKEALAQFEKAAAVLEPGKPPTDDGRRMLAVAYFRIAKAYGSASKWPEARAAIAKYEAVDADNKHGYADDLVPYKAVAAAEHDNNIDAALKIVDEGLAKWPESNIADCLGYLKGAFLHEKREHAKAVEVWKAVAAKYPKTIFGRRAKEAAEHDH